MFAEKWLKINILSVQTTIDYIIFQKFQNFVNGKFFDFPYLDTH
jgi:hypothetical protein